MSFAKNDQFLAAQASFAQFNIERERRTRLFENTGGIYDLVQKHQLGEVLADTDEGRLIVYFSDVIASWQWQYRELQAGRLPDDFVDLNLWRGIWGANPLLRDLYHERKAGYDPSFVEFVEANLVSNR